MRILTDSKYYIYYEPSNKTVYVYPPIKVRHLTELKEALKYYDLEIDNIIVGKRFDTY